MNDMEAAEEIVIVGAGIAGLATALGLHRLGLRSLVLETADGLRTTGFALATWTNAWKALDVLGIAEPLRGQHHRLFGVIASSTVSGQRTAESSFEANETKNDNEVRGVQRKTLLETLEKELPVGTIRFSSKVVTIEESGYLKLVHLADGTVLKAKVLIGCDGVNSVVAKWLGFKKPAFTGRSAIRACVYYDSSHGFEHKMFQYFGEGVRSGFIPCDDKTLYWFFTFSASSQEKEIEENPAKLKQFMLSNLGKVSDQIRAIIDKTEFDNMILSPLRFRHPWEILWGNIAKDNVCVAGDAFHPMTPDIGQGGCSALEDGVVLARCIGRVLRSGQRREEKEEYKQIKMGLQSYAKERRWRAVALVSTAYMVGQIQQSKGNMLTFLRDKILPAFLAGRLMKMASYDCGKLTAS